MFRYLVLGLLRNGGPAHGYALTKEYKKRAGIQVNSGNFYREFQRLIVDGLVRTASNPPDADARRVLYEITDAGLAAFDAWLADPELVPTWSHEDDLSARALFLGEVDTSIAQAMLDRWQDELWLRGRVLDHARQGALGHGSDEQDVFPALALLLARRLKHVAADLEFVAEFRAAWREWQAARHGAVPRARSARRRSTRAGQSETR